MERGENRFRSLKGPGKVWAVKDGRLGLEAGGMLGQGEERARGRIVMGLEEVVDEVRGEGNEVEDEQAEDQRDRTAVPPFHLTTPISRGHDGATLAD